MGTEPREPTVAEAVLRAVVVTEPDGGVTLIELVREFEDDDRPITTVEDPRAMLAAAFERLDPDGELPALVVAGAVITYLAFRRAEIGDDRDTLIRLAVRAELGEDRPAAVSDWLEHEGIAT